MWQLLGIYKAFANHKAELVNNGSKYKEIVKSIRKDSEKLKGVEDDPTCSEEQRQWQRDRQAKLEILPETREDVQTQIARIKQIIEKVVDEDTVYSR